MPYLQMSLYRDAERQRRKRRRQQQRKQGGKKSSLGAALSASLTALFVGGKDYAPTSDCGDNDYYYGSASSTNATAADADRVEYVTVRGCRPSCDDDDSGGGELSSEDENHDGDDFDFGDVSVDGDDHYDYTKGLAQMAVTLGKYKRFFFYKKLSGCYVSVCDYNYHCYHYCYLDCFLYNRPKMRICQIRF